MTDPLERVRRAWRGLMVATNPGGACYPYAWPEQATPEMVVALSIATYAPRTGAPRSRLFPVLWWSTRSDCARRLGRAAWCHRLPARELPLPPVADWPPDARAWLYRELAPGRTHAEVAEVLPYGLWPAVERDALAWHLRHDEGWTGPMVAALLGLTPRAVRMAVARHVGRS
jgi:hypothetical protein